MVKYLIEEDEIGMDVQVGPRAEEIEVTAEPEEGAPTPVDVAKADPGNIVVAAVKVDDDPEAGNDEPKLEFYVDARDIENYGVITGQSLAECLNDVISANEEAGMNADNLVVILGESTIQYEEDLDELEAYHTFISEGGVDDIEMDVQVGPNEDEIEVSADPQEANPVDAVKRDYDTVTIAKKDGNFFVDVEDVQKCADLNCESAIDTLNQIILMHEGSGMDADNIVILVREGVEYPAVAEFNEAESNFNCQVY
jgi:hypothetical protein